MIIRPQSKGFICLTAHPDGCAQNVATQIDIARRAGRGSGPQLALVIGASTGYGLASRIVAGFGYGAKTVGVAYEKPAEGQRTASPGWYNTAAFELQARQQGLPSHSINGDAFSHDIKRRTLNFLKEKWGPVNLVVYSVAAPRRTHPDTGEVFTSVLKPLLKPYTSKTVNFQTGALSDVSIPAASQTEINHTVAVMGGDDWSLWIDALDESGLLAPGAATVAYSYAGPSLTEAIYRGGTIGRAKDHLEETARRLNARLARVGGRAVVSVNKALVTQASAAIPVMPLYISLLYRVMKEKNVHEGCIEQIVRLFNDHLYSTAPKPLDDQGRIRLDDWEMRPDVQDEVTRRWTQVSPKTIDRWADLPGFREDFFKLFGFGWPGVKESADVDPAVSIS